MNPKLKELMSKSRIDQEDFDDMYSRLKETDINKYRLFIAITKVFIATVLDIVLHLVRTVVYFPFELLLNTLGGVSSKDEIMTFIYVIYRFPHSICILTPRLMYYRHKMHLAMVDEIDAERANA